MFVPVFIRIYFFIPEDVFDDNKNNKTGKSRPPIKEAFTAEKLT